MQTTKTNGFYKLVSFILIAVLLLCLVGFAASGWQSKPDNEPDSGENGATTDKTDENKDGSDNLNNNENSDNKNDSTEDPVTVYTNTITGLSVSLEESTRIPYGFVMDPKAPLYGISFSDLTIEFPLENGSTRILSYTTDPSHLWKIGALAPTRAFISGMSALFGGIIISHGKDDIVKYATTDTSKSALDLSLHENSCFWENSLYVYTSKDITENLLKLGNQIQGSEYKRAPYDFAVQGETTKGTTDATSVHLSYSAAFETQLYYSDTSDEYVYFKNGSRKIDMLSGKNIAFKNVFILFANTTTYEKADGTELVVETFSGGHGYYISSGTKTEIRWNINENGELEFKTLNGERLIANRGNAYIGYFKASNASGVTIQ